MYSKLLFCTVLTLLVSLAYTLPNGAPTGACSTMMPRHVNRMNGGLLSSQNLLSSPYSINVSRTNFTRNTRIRVSIYDSRPANQSGYRGILLQARLASSFNSGPQGSWMCPPQFTKTVTCTNESDSITHSEVMNLKNDDTVFIWKAPSDFDIGNIEFVATVAQTREMFWARIESDVVMQSTNDGSGEGPTMAENDDDDTCGASAFYASAISFLVTMMTALIMS